MPFGKSFACRSQEKNNMKLRPSIALIENNHLLLLRYRYGSTDVFQLPGGNLDDGETLPQTLVRELQEELNIEIEVGKFLLLGEVLVPKPTLHIVFNGMLIGGIPVINPKESSALEVDWLPLAKLTEVALYPNVGIALLETLAGVRTSPYLGEITQVWY